MRIVVTRPEASGLKTANRLQALGHEPVLLPMVRPVHLASVVSGALMLRPQILAVTSAEAIRALKDHLPQHPAIADVPLFAVGAASARAAREAGFTNVVAGQNDGPALAALIAEAVKSRPIHGEVTYFAGALREQGFERALLSLDVPFNTVEVYEMVDIVWQRNELDHALCTAHVDAVLLYSAHAARRFFTLCETQGVSTCLGGTRFIAISEKVRTQVPELYRSVAWASVDPVEEQMFDLLERKAGT